ncbi:rhamnulokinase [Micrococcales bacterium 31B]|nr:rhamnulokinase [Micrococcales bacterium 31B]
MSSVDFFVAVDLGATSGRVVLASVGSGRAGSVAGIDPQVVHRFANDLVRVPRADGTTDLYWSMLELWRETQRGLALAAAEARRRGGRIVSIGVDSWAVDYALLRDGQLLGNPRHYRDDRTAGGVRAVHAIAPHAELYGRNGLQFLPFNSLYQLACDAASGTLTLADRALLVPDLFAYWLTGEQRSERTNASTTGLLHAVTGDFDAELMGRLGLPGDLFAPLIEPGEAYGPVLPALAAELGLGPDARVVAVGSHDTASAVAATPLGEPTAAYISSGTWSLVGVERESTVLTEAARQANFTNELGVDGTVRFLKNVSGLWLLSECMREWSAAGTPEQRASELQVLLAEAASVEGEVPIFDADDPCFIAPRGMPARIQSWCREHGVAAPESRAEIVRSIVASLAEAYRRALAAAAELGGREVTSVHIVGGGSLNTLLCQEVANVVGVPVLAGPVEATALGNIAVQARAAGVVTGGLAEMRALVAASAGLVRYEPAVARV